MTFVFLAQIGLVSLPTQQGGGLYRKSLLCSYSKPDLWAPKREHSFNPIKYRMPIFVFSAKFLLLTQSKPIQKKMIPT